MQLEKLMATRIKHTSTPNKVYFLEKGKQNIIHFFAITKHIDSELLYQ